MVGNRASRVKLVENRLSSQTTTFKTLQSENEDADATEVAVQLSSAQVSYQAALMATSDMIKETLLNYL
jgi:flagellar hook-associated protein 3 FlgL